MHALQYPGPSTQQKPTLERQTSNATLRGLACRVIELRFAYQNTRGDTQVAGLLKGSVGEVRAWTLMAFKRLRELGPTDAHRAKLDRRLVDHAANPDDVVPLG
jgi:hypothetical protein